MDESKWFLRIGTGVVFGPVTLSGLKDWAQQGRVQADNFVSHDRKTWIAVTEISELDLTWFLEGASGELLGPFNPVAAERLAKSSRVAKGARPMRAEEISAAKAVSDAEKVGGETTSEQKSAHAAEDAEKHGAKRDLPLTDDELPLEPPGIKIEPRRRSAPGKSQNSAEVPEDAEKIENFVFEQKNDTEFESTKKDELITMEIFETKKNDAAEAAENQSNLAPQDFAAEKIAALEKQNAEISADLAKQAEYIKDLEARLAKAELVQTELEQTKVAADSLRSELASAEKDAAEQKSAFGELLAFSNERDAKALAAAEAAEKRIAELEAQIEEMKTVKPPEPGALREASTRLTEQQSLMDLFVKEERAAIVEALAMEHDGATRRHEESLQLKKIFQARLESLNKLFSGDITELAERDRTMKSTIAEGAQAIARLKELERQFEVFKQKASDTEGSLTKRSRLLEIEADGLRSKLNEVTRLAQENERLIGQLRNRDAEIASERKARAAEKQQLEEAYAALMTRLESMEKDTLPISAASEQSSPARNTAITGFLRLKK